MNLKDNLDKVRQLITTTELENNRKDGDVLLVAVSKKQSVAAISAAFALGVTHFGESYLQEAEQKINLLQDLPLCWHFIGPIQSNKTKGIANHFSWVHSINRIKIAQLLNEQRSPHLAPLNVCLQINLIAEESKSGVTPEAAGALAVAVGQLPHLKLRGLMTIPPPQTDPQKQYEVFLRLAQLMHSLNQQLGLAMDTLSMGMSADLIPAIKAGATIVRVGEAIFGQRQSG